MQSAERWSTRSDAWTRDDDDRLSAIVLSHIRTGNTQLRAFEEAASELGRTAAACGYRWNGVLRKERRNEIDSAKVERKSAQRRQPGKAPVRRVETATTTTMTSSDSMQEVINFLQAYDTQYQKLRQQVEALEEERDMLQEKLRETEASSNDNDSSGPSITPEQLEQDSQALFAIMERARRLLDPSVSKRTD
jgi:prespore-specific regulator